MYIVIVKSLYILCQLNQVAEYIEIAAEVASAAIPRWQRKKRFSSKVSKNANAFFLSKVPENLKSLLQLQVS